MKSHKKTATDLPSEVYVLGHRYTIKAMSTLLFKEREAYGDCCNEQKKIRVYEKVKKIIMEGSDGKPESEA